jgi:putative transport protein
MPTTPIFNTSTEQLLVLVSILTLGSAVGRFSFRGFSLGSTGVLVIALVFGHFGFHVPGALKDFGLLIFAYAVGLLAGPHFFRSFRRSRLRYLLLGLTPVITALVLSLVIGRVLDLDPALMVGLFSGALTNNSSLAAALDAMERSGLSGQAGISISYGVVYPFSMLVVVLLMQLLPRISRRPIVDEEAAWLERRLEDEPPIQVRQFQISRQEVHGRSLHVLALRKDGLNLVRITRGPDDVPVSPETELRLGDILTVLGKPSAHATAEAMFGTALARSLDPIPGSEIELSNPVYTGKALEDLSISQRHRVIISAISRHGFEFVPHGRTVLALGDRLRLSGSPADVSAFAQYLTAQRHLLEETRMFSFLLGIFIGTIVGCMRIPLGDLGELRLGIPAGTFFVGLVLAHSGRLGPFSIHVPTAASNLCRELGLMLFLSWAGTTAGDGLLSVLSSSALHLCLAGVLVTSASLFAVFFAARRLCSMTLLETLGVISGTMNNPAGLMAIRLQTSSDTAPLAYMSVYPVSLIAKIVIAQLLVLFLR